MVASELMELKAALDLYSAQYSATDKLWAYFSSVSLAVLGFSVASDKVSKSFVEASVVVFGYIVFCIGNFTALILSHRQLGEIAAIARAVAKKYEISLTTLQPIADASVARFYWVVVAAICGGILFITWYRNTKRGTP